MAVDDKPIYELPGVEGHEFGLLQEGPQRLDSLVALIDGAKTSVKLLYFTFADDAAGRRVRDALIAAHERGVRVALLIDGFGSGDTPDDFFAGLRETDCYFCRHAPKRTRRYLLRNHQKMVIADGVRAIIGGLNIKDGYFAAHGRVGWRDIGLAIQGAAAGRLARYFDDIAEWSVGKPSDMRVLRAILHRHHEQDGAVRWLFGGPTRGLSPWGQTLRNDMFAANTINIIAAYFAPHSSFLRPIRSAGKRGSARLISAAKSDNTTTISAARNRFKHVLPECEVYEYGLMKLHTKLFIMDDIVYIGSANFDTRSLYLNLEMMLRVRDAAFASRMRAYVDTELADCARITPEEYAQGRTLGARIRRRLSYFLISVVDYNISRRLNFGLDGQ